MCKGGLVSLLTAQAMLNSTTNINIVNLRTNFITTSKKVNHLVYICTHRLYPGLGKHAGREKSRSEQKREAIIEATKCAFKEMGVQGCSIDKLAELA